MSVIKELEAQELKLKHKVLAFMGERQATECDRYARSDEYKGFWLNDDDAPAYRYADITYETKVQLPWAKKIMREMRDDGMVELVMTIDSVNCAPCGSGWFLTYKGLQYAVDNDLVRLEIP